MSWGHYRTFSATVTSANSISGEVDVGRPWTSVYLEIRSMISNSAINILASPSLGGTYRKLNHPVINTSAAEINSFVIESAMSNGIVPIPNGFQFYKVHQTATADSGAEYRFICSDT